jgi:uncharacterized protein (DUF427 family)
MRVQAIWKGRVVADSDETIKLEGNHYFPPEDVDHTYLRPSERHTVCPWKGVASYCDLVVDDEVNANAAWFYPEPRRAAHKIEGRIAFWHGVEIRRVGDEAGTAESSLWSRLRRRLIA